MSQQRLPKSVDSDKALTPRQKEIVDHIMLTGESPYAAAEHLGTDPSNIYRILRMPHVKKNIQQRALDHVGLLSLYAVRTQEQLLVSDSDHVRASVAENILDRHLGKPVMRSQVAVNASVNVSIDLS